MFRSNNATDVCKRPSIRCDTITHATNFGRSQTHTTTYRHTYVTVQRSTIESPPPSVSISPSPSPPLHVLLSSPATIGRTTPCIPRTALPQSLSSSFPLSTGQATFRLRGSNGSQCFRVNPLWTCSYTASDTCDARRISPPQFTHFISGNLLPHTHVPLPSIPACMSVRIPCTRGRHTWPIPHRPCPVGSGVRSVSQVRPASTQDHTSC